MVVVVVIGGDRVVVVVMVGDRVVDGAV